MAAKENQHPVALAIKKYPNRRYYDTGRSRHVTLEELYDLVRAGAEIKVSDSKTGEDITTQVLAKILLEHDPPKLDIFPVELLHRIIRANEVLVSEFIEKYFSQAFTAFIQSQQRFEQFFRQSMGFEASGRETFQANPLFMNPFLGMFAENRPTATDRGGEPPSEQAGHRATSASGGASIREHVQQLNEEVSRLRDRLTEMQHQSRGR